MAVYVHKKLQCLVTEQNYQEFGIPSLDDPDMYQVTDIPEGTDFLECNVVFGEPTWDESNKTVQMHPTITPIDDAYKQHLLQQFRDTGFQENITQGYDEVWKRFVFHGKDTKAANKILRFATDVTSLLSMLRNEEGKFTDYNLPVLLCDGNYPFEAHDKQIMHFSSMEIESIYYAYQSFIRKASSIAQDRYLTICKMSYPEVVSIIKKQNVDNGIIPDNVADIVTFKKEKNSVTRTVTRK